MNIIEKGTEINYLASMAVFQQMFNQKKGMSDIICSFIEHYIINSKIHNFFLEDIYKGINDFYNFKLPIAIIRSSLRKFDKVITKNNQGYYSVDIAKLPKFSNNGLFEDNKTINDEIIDNLERYIEDKREKNLTTQEKIEVFDGFCSFLMGDKVDCHFQKYISSFVIESSKDEKIKKQLDDINEGLIIYTGITSELDPSKLGSWKTNLTLYLDQEILFHIVGYNGEFFKKQADDFLSLVSEINRKEKLIKLLYFDNVKRDTEHFFNNAEAIVSGKMISNGTIAMAFVTKDCSEPSDVITKKGIFYSKLQNLGIECDLEEYFSNENNNKYCVQSDFEPMLSLINILRKGENNKPIQNIKFFLITGTRATLSQAYSLIQEADKAAVINNFDKDKFAQKPLAKSLEDITKLFWFALNKSFGHSYKLMSFDVIHKAKIVLSSILSGKIKDNYAKLNKEFIDGNLTKEAVVNCIDELRNKFVLPEDIQSDKVDCVLNLIETSDIEHIQNEKELKQQQLQEMQSEKERIEQESAEKDVKIAVLEKELKDKDNFEKEQAKLDCVNTQNQKNRIVVIVKVLLLLIVLLGCYFMLKFIIRIESINLIGLIGSVITIVSLIIIIINNFIIKPYKNNKDKINMTKNIDNI